MLVFLLLLTVNAYRFARKENTSRMLPVLLLGIIVDLLLLERKLERRTEWKNVGRGESGLSQMNDRELLEKAFSAKNGDTVRRLYNGEDLRHNHSNSDMSLMNYLAFYSGGNVEQMTRIFATSGLYRPDKPASYYEYTAIKAAKDTPHYTPPRASNAAPKAASDGNSKA